MFTGIIEEVGIVHDISYKGKSAKINIQCSKVLDGTNVGDSIAVNGVCLTVVEGLKDSFSADISYTTLEHSSLNSVKSGFKVNLERALQLSSRLGGHLVLGHVDEVGRISSIKKIDNSFVLKVSYSNAIDKFIVKKGSITIDGISLTIASVGSCEFDIAVIPHTYEVTNLLHKKVGDYVNLEIDMLARYAEKLINSKGKDERLISLVNDMA